MKDLNLQFLARTWNTFPEVMLAMSLECCREKKGPHKAAFVHDIVCIHSFMINADLIEYNIVGDTKTPLPRCFLVF